MALTRRNAYWKIDLLLGPEFQVVFRGLPVMGCKNQNGVRLSLLFFECPYSTWHHISSVSVVG